MENVSTAMAPACQRRRERPPGEASRTRTSSPDWVEWSSSRGSASISRSHSGRPPYGCHDHNACTSRFSERVPRSTHFLLSATPSNLAAASFDVTATSWRRRTSATSGSSKRTRACPPIDEAASAVHRRRPLPTLGLTDWKRMRSEQISHSRVSETDAILVEPHFSQFHFLNTYFMRPLAFGRHPRRVLDCRWDPGDVRRRESEVQPYHVIPAKSGRSSRDRLDRFVLR